MSCNLEWVPRREQFIHETQTGRLIKTTIGRYLSEWVLYFAHNLCFWTYCSIITDNLSMTVCDNHEEKMMFRCL